MDENKVYSKLFNGGMDSDTAPEFLGANKTRYALNCISSSVAEGEQGIITNPKGNVLIEIELPEGENKTIGALEDEENKRFFYAVWNSKGRHTWFMYESSSNSITKVLQSITDTGNEDIFGWSSSDLILGINIVDGDKLYFTIYGDDNPARKINIPKLIAKDTPGYEDSILRSYTLAFKEPPVYPPEVVYFTESNLRSNNVYGSLFKFATRYIYDDYELSTFSDFSKVAVPEEEDVTGTKGVPLINNGIRVSFLTGNALVRKIELVMKKTNPDVTAPNSENDWVSLVVLDKETLSIPDNTQYEYNFYNDHSYLSVSQEEVIMPYSELPDFPKGQDYSGNVLFYSNFKSGFPTVVPDFDIAVTYEDLFVPDSTENVPNNPFFAFNEIRVWYQSGGFLSKGWRHKEGTLIVGSDVKAGNVFTLTIDESAGEIITLRYVANLNDTAATVAAFFRGRIASMDQATTKGSYVGTISQGLDGSARFNFDMWNHGGRPYIEFYTSATPVNYARLKDTGNSVINEKLGSSFRYGIIYEAVDTSKKSLVYVDVDNLAMIDNLSQLGEIKKPSTTITINHRAPSWAQRWQLVRTRNLTKSSYIQILIQAKATITDSDSNELYQDLIIGSLFTYQQIHADTSLRYEFKKGDRLRALKIYDDATDNWIVQTNVIDYDVINYFPEVVTTINSNATVDGTNNVAIGDTPDANNVGSYIRINGSERLITDVGTGSYQVEFPFTEQVENTGPNRTYPSYTIINRRGVLRIKENEDYPIDIVNGSKYALVEVFRPSQTFENAESENYYEIGYKFDIVSSNGQYFHRGNVQDQTATLPAVVKVEGFDNYVRNRQLPTNNTPKNTQLIFTSVEDASYSDFYVSDLSSYGRVNRLDEARGVVEFKESVIHSQNRIEGSRLNGLSMFRNINRKDYNDKYGSIERIMFHDSILYVLKNLKIGYLPVNANIISDTSGQNRILTAADQVIPQRIEYVPWEDGVGESPESAFRWGNDIWLMCPNSGVLLKVQGGGGQVVSTPLKFDKEIRDKVTLASISGAKIIGGYDPFLKFCIWNIEGFEVVVFNNGWFQNNSEIVPVPVDGSWNIVGNPTNGSIELSGNVITYFPNTNYSGVDSFSYRAGNGIVRNVLVNIASEETQLVWRGDGESCVIDQGSRTGFVEISILRQYDVLAGSYTGLTKPNATSDPDYIAPYEDLNRCPLGTEYVYLATLDRRLNNQVISFTVESIKNYNIVIKQSQDFSSTTIAETGIISSGNSSLTIPIANADAFLFFIVEDGDYNDVTVFSATGAYFKSANFNSLPSLKKLVLDQSGISTALNTQFTSLSLDQLTDLEELRVIRHEIASIDLSYNNLLSYVDVSYGKNLVNMLINNWSILKTLRVHESAFTSSGYNPTFVNSILSNMANLSISPVLLQYGLNNISGVQPSQNTINLYNTLIGKGASVVGKSPQQASVNLTLGLTDDGFNIRYVGTLSAALSMNITVRIFGQVIYSNGSGIGVDRTFVIPSGTLSSGGDIFGNGSMIMSYQIEITNVTPNPAGGTQIIF